MTYDEHNILSQQLLCIQHCQVADATTTNQLGCFRRMLGNVPVALICLLTSFHLILLAYHALASLCAPIYALHLLLLAAFSSDCVPLQLAELLQL